MADNRAFVFGPGVAYMTLQTYNDGSAPVKSWPHRLDVMQELSVDFDLTTKRLFGQNIYPEAIGLGEGKITGKVKHARFQAYMINDISFGTPGGVTTGSQLVRYNESTVIPATPFQVTVAPPSSGTFVEDLGVFYSSTGAALKPVDVGATLAIGQYKVTAGGQYTFYSGDAAATVFINYAYSVTGGFTVTVPQILQGSVAALKLRYQGQYGGRNVGLVIPNVVTNKFTLPTKQQDFVMGEIDFEAFVDATGNVAYLYLADQ